MADQSTETKVDFGVWKNRGEALSGAQGAIRKLFPEVSAKGTNNLKTLAECLEEFAAKQFFFFHDGFGERTTYHLNRSREFPPEHVFSVILNQVAEDLEVIRRAADQRRSLEMAQIEKADKLAWSALKPVVGPGKLIEDDESQSRTMAMTYFQKGASIRVIPYAPVALIGIPFLTNRVGRDYLAVPHEVGHYVYRHGKLSGGKSIPQTLGKSLLELGIPRWVRRWKEEIFADVYGCLIGGPVAALSFQDLMRQYSRTPIIQTPGEYLYGQFSEDDGVHPVAVVRPYVYSKTLREIKLLNEGLASWADKLEVEWQKLPQVQETTEFRSRYAGEGPQYLNVQETLGYLDTVVKEVLELLPLSDLIKARWSGRDGTSVTEVRDLYQAFEETDLTSIEQTTLSSTSLTCSDTLWQEWVKREKFFPAIDRPPSKDEAIIDPGKAQRLEELEQEPRYTWNHVFLAGGWGTKYPGESSAGVVIPKNWRNPY